MPTPRSVTDKHGFPQRTRLKGRNRESMDLDDILNGSDEDLSSTRPPVKPSMTPKKVSRGTRDLIDFLAEGPPQTPTVSRAGRNLVGFLAEEPPEYNSSNISLDKSKGSGNRLHKMISKLNLGNNEKSRGSSDVPRTPQHPRFESKGSNSTLSSLANKPIPPRPPRAPNALSIFPVCDIPDKDKAILLRTASLDFPFRDPPVVQESSKTGTRPVPDPSENASISIPPPSTFVHTNGVGNETVPISPPRSPSQHVLRSPIKAVIPLSVPPPATVGVEAIPTIAEPDIRDMHRLLTNATTADECRLIFGMFMARNGIFLEPKQEFSNQIPYLGSNHTGLEACLESSLVELLLGNSTSFELVAS